MEKIVARIKELEKEIKRLGAIIKPLKKIVSFLDKLPGLLSISTFIGVIIITYDFKGYIFLWELLEKSFHAAYLFAIFFAILQPLIEGGYNLLKSIVSYLLKKCNVYNQLALAENLTICIIIVTAVGCILYATYFWGLNILWFFFFPFLIFVTIIELVLLHIAADYLLGLDIDSYEKYLELNTQLSKTKQASEIKENLDFLIETTPNESRKRQFVVLRNHLNSYYEAGMPPKKNIYLLTDKVRNELNEIEKEIKKINAETSINNSSETTTPLVNKVNSVSTRATNSTITEKQNNKPAIAASPSQRGTPLIIGNRNPANKSTQSTTTTKIVESVPSKPSYNLDFVSKTLNKVFAKKERKQKVKEYKVVDALDTLFTNKAASVTEKSKKALVNNTENLSGEDYIAQAKEKQKIGLAGELFIMNSEREALIQAGRPDLAKKVSHQALDKGNYLGYDILSYDKLGNEKYIEVKTSASGYSSDFFLTKNELDTIRILGNYFIYRVFDFDMQQQQGSIYIVNCEKELDAFFILEPMAYRVKPRNKYKYFIIKNQKNEQSQILARDCKLARRYLLWNY